MPGTRPGMTTTGNGELNTMADRIPEEAKNFKLLGHDPTAGWGGGSIVEINKGFA